MPYRLDGLLSWCLRLTWLYIAVTTAGLIATWFELDLLKRVASGELSGLDAQQAAEQSDNIVAIFGLAEVAVSIIAFIVNGVWIYRASSNARAIDPWEGRIRPGWAIGWFFIPIANLWMPYRAMKQTWRTAHGLPHDSDTPLPGWFLFWWLLWLFSDITGNISIRMTTSAEVIQTYILADYFTLASSLTALPCAWLFMRLMREASAGLDDRRSLSQVFA
ncbi:MAG: DUF4328 domain-containing protein [Alphaproteobacteria bacterium]|nr:DUF4328 domain-containing protein [Alphaproteobacteria bacterium]